MTTFQPNLIFSKTFSRAYPGVPGGAVATRGKRYQASSKVSGGPALKPPVLSSLLGPITYKNQRFSRDWPTIPCRSESGELYHPWGVTMAPDGFFYARILSQQGVTKNELQNLPSEQCNAERRPVGPVLGPQAPAVCCMPGGVGR
jgi:hypothetical protein